ncbi:hypothetical protein PR048_019139 [Dryococelus australis]|uniref:PiggyBac transposable element-derived protein domain-containing protein n=1 Tax=Dryococelus australis TaxID=614101 RepID=A0ABQ9H2P8_9NEOP|nr:hypothetical protein PR048_019139 [Dryococelus australis]
MNRWYPSRVHSPAQESNTAGASGIVYDFYGGSDTFLQHQFSSKEENMGLGSKGVVGLCQTIPNPALTTVYFDNFFTSLVLLYHLRQEHGSLVLESERYQLIRLSHAELLYRRWTMKKKFVVVKRVDNFVGREPITYVKRFSEMETKKQLDVPYPNIVKKYNVHVDVADMLIALYGTPLKAKKWYLTIFGHLLDLCVINAWLLNRREVAFMKEKYNDGTENFSGGCR